MIIKEKKLVVENRSVENPVVVKIGSLDHNFIPGTKMHVNIADAIFSVYPGVLVVPEFTRVSVINDILFVRYGSLKNGWMPSTLDCERLQALLVEQPISSVYSKVVVIPEIFNVQLDEAKTILTLDSIKAVERYGVSEEFVNAHVQRAGIILDMLNKDSGFFKQVDVL